MDIKKEFERWLVNATADADVAAELKMLDDTKIEDAFYRDLAFGTGGLRGVIGAGTNRMNVYTVAKASQGLADYTAFVEQVKSQSVLFGEEVNKDVAIVYSPLNGTGLKPVTRTLKEMGYTNITVVKEQERPDGNFPTCPYPNPEIKEAMALGMEYAKKCNADLLLATDPDCDRVGIAVKNKAGEYELLTGNQTGMLLLDYICSQRVKHGKMPTDPVMVKTIVTMDMGEQIATHYGLRTINVLTGFKFIGEQIGKLEKQGKADSYVFGFEESYGYLTGSYVRDSMKSMLT